MQRILKFFNVATIFLFACLSVSLLQAIPPANFTLNNILPTIKHGTTVVQTADSRLFITELGGDLKTYKNGASYTLHHFPTSNARSEQGLFGLAVDPNYASNGWMYVHYFVYVNGGDQDYHVIMRFTLSTPLGGNPAYVDGSEYLIYRMPNLPGGASRHNGGHLVFGNDGFLYIAKGEGERQEQADNLTNVFGKLIRIDAHSTTASNSDVNGHYGIPTGNPGYAKPEIFANGFRNPWSMTKDPSSEDIYLGDVGGTEEVNRIIPSQHVGKKFGWGAGGNSGMYNCGDAAYACPMVAYGGGAITGVAIKRNIGSAWPAPYANAVFYSDHNGRWIKYTAIGTNGGTIFDSGDQPLGLTFGEADGDMYYCTYNRDGLWQVHYNGTSVVAPAIATHPQNTSVNSGNQANFSVVASGSTLAYKWQSAPIGSTTFTDLVNNTIFSGVTTANLTITATVSQAANYRVIVSNTAGSVTSNSAQLTVLAANAPPVITFVSPAQGSFFTIPNQINFSATANDPEQGVLPASAFHWDIELGHRVSPTNYHTHPVTFFDGIKSGSFPSTVEAEPSPQVWLLLILTVTDNAGNIDKDTLSIYPNLTTVTAKSVPAGLNVVVMDLVKTDTTFPAVIGNDGRINANTPQFANGNRYDFEHWSFSGDVPPELNTTTVFQNFIVRGNPTTFTANYIATPVPTLQAEAAAFVGATVGNGYAGYHGTGFLDYQNASNDYIEWTAAATTAGVYTIGFRYALSAGNRPLKLTINGVDVVASLSFPATGAFTTWATINTVQNLIAGNNKIRLTAIGSSGGNFDEMTYSLNGPPNTKTYGVTLSVANGLGSVSPVGTTQVTAGANLTISATPSAGYVFAHWHATGVTVADLNNPNTNVVSVNAIGTVQAHFDTIQSVTTKTFPAENATFVGPVFGNNYTGYNGTGFLDYQNASIDYIEWTVPTTAAGSYNLAFRYAQGSGNRSLKLRINGVDVVASLTFAATGSFNTWATVTSTQSLINGSNKIRLTAIGSSGGNFDELTVSGAGLAKRGSENFSATPSRNYLGLQKNIYRLSSAQFIPIGLANNVDDNALLEFKLISLEGKISAYFKKPIIGLMEYQWDVGNNSNLKPGLYFYQVKILGLETKIKSGKLMLLR